MMAQILEFAANHPIMVIAFVSLLALVFFNELKVATQNFASLTPAAAVQLMNNENVVVLDVREPAETAVGGKIDKAILDGVIVAQYSAFRNCQIATTGRPVTGMRHAIIFLRWQHQLWLVAKRKHIPQP